ncbi:hypothetical protein ABG768_001636 [Culter alburnus]|uniref:Ribonuclease A-domain domain-containing protein n=1 Tax=Culter alburnus TaxID=194366 RepID=A0AAW2A297_CULAL
MKIHQSTVILLLVICTSLPTYSQNYEAFKRKHVAPGMRAKDCTAVIENRRINRYGPCKQTNTFIIAAEAQIKEVCISGKGDGKTYKSNTYFYVIDCTFDKKEWNSCKYKDDVNPKVTQITLTCEGGVPVHYGPAKTAG